MTTPALLSSVPNVNPYIQYVAAGGQTVFPYPFPITLDADLIVIINGVTQPTDSGYTLSGVGNPTGGNLTFTLGRTGGDIITLYRNIAIQRVTQISQNSGFSSTTFNAEYNQIYLLLQQLQEAISFCLQVPNTNNPLPTAALTPGAYANKYLSFDANGNPTPALLTSSGALTRAILGGLLYPQSLAEAAAGVVPADTSLVYGAYRRYGADPLGIANSSVAITNATKCNSFVFDDYPGGGNYLLNAEIALANYPVRITGQAANEAPGVVPNAGTVFTLATAAGAGAAHIHAAGFITDVTIEHIGFAWQTCTTGQKAIRFDNDTRNCTIQYNKFVWRGAQTNGNNLIAIQMGGVVYSGGNTIFANYFSALRNPIFLLGPCTTIKITNNDLFGHSCPNSVATLNAPTGGTLYVNGVYNSVALTGGTGTGMLAQVTVSGNAVTGVLVLDGGSGYTVGDSLTTSNANIGGLGSGFSVTVATLSQVFGGFGMRLQYPTEGPVLTGNYTEGFSTGIYGEGAAYIKQLGTDSLGANLHHFVWVKTTVSDVASLPALPAPYGFTRVWNQSVAETYGAGDFVYPFNNNDLCMVWSNGTYVVDTAAISAYRGFVEQGRVLANGHQTLRAFAAGNYTGGGGWTVTSGQTLNDTLVINGNEATYYFFVSGSSVTGGNPKLSIALPAGVNASARTRQSGVWVSDNGTASSLGVVEILNNGTSVDIYKDATVAANWSASVTNTSVAGSLKFPMNGSVN